MRRKGDFDLFVKRSKKVTFGLKGYGTCLVPIGMPFGFKTFTSIQRRRKGHMEI